MGRPRTGLYPEHSLSDFQVQVSERAGRTVLSATLSNVLRGALRPPADVAQAIAAIMEIPQDQFREDWQKMRRKWERRQRIPPF